MEVQLQLAGSLLVALAVLHLGFPKRFRWSETLQPLDLLHRQMMKVHTFFIALTVLLMGVLCLVAAPDLVHTPLGKLVSRGMGLFWALRLAVQLFVYSPRLWKGKPFETSMHVVFTALWVYLAVVFLWNGWA